MASLENYRIFIIFISYCAMHFSELFHKRIMVAIFLMTQNSPINKHLMRGLQRVLD